MYTEPTILKRDLVRWVTRALEYGLIDDDLADEIEEEFNLEIERTYDVRLDFRVSLSGVKALRTDGSPDFTDLISEISDALLAQSRVIDVSVTDESSEPS